MDLRPQIRLSDIFKAVKLYPELPTSLMCSEILQQIRLSHDLYSMTHRYVTQARSFDIKFTHTHIMYTHTTMRYQCEILNHGIHDYEVWLHGCNQGRSEI